MNDLDVAAYIDRGLEPHRLTEVEDHLAYCEQCREHLVKAQELVDRSHRPRIYVRSAIIVAVAAAIALVAVPTLKKPANTRDAMRASSQAQPLAAYGPVGDIRSTPVRFTWAAVRDALSYHLTISTDAGAAVWSASSSDTSLVTPPSVSFSVGNRYLWSVDAIATDGTTQSTGTHEFGIVP